jgi:hypothetical protein
MLALLMESALRTLLLGLAVWLGLKMFRRRNPQLQMTAWTVVLVASLSMPLLMRGLTVTIPAAAPPQLVTIPRLPPERMADALTSPYLQQEVPMFPPQAPESNEQQPPRLATSAGPNWWGLATGLYLMIGGTMLLRLLTGLVLTWRLIRAARPAGDVWAAGVDVRVSDTVTMPVTFASTILLPAEFAGWDAVKRQAVLSHEGSHVARGDFYVLLLAGFNRCLFWFNPLSWWLVRRLTELAEIISDDAAIAVVGDRPSYAEILLDVAGQVGRVPAARAPIALAMARPRTVRQRVERILTATGLPTSMGWGKRARFATCLIPLVAVCALTIAHGGSPTPAVAQSAPAAGRPQATLDPKGFDLYVGFYRADPNVLPDLVLTITREGDHLFEQRTGSAKLEVFPENDHEFVYGLVKDSHITFVRDAQGHATAVVLHQNGSDVVATRTDEAEAKRVAELHQQRFADQARPRTAITIDPSAFDRYVGYYALNAQFVFRITRDGDRFFTQLTGQPKVEVFPESDTDYFARIVQAQITFVTDAQGQATGLVLHQNGREFPARGVAEAQALAADATFEEQAKRRAEEARPRTAIAVDPRSLDLYVGFYEAGPQSIFTITRTDDQLFAQLTGQRKLPIFPEGEREYFYKAVAAQITFATDDQGRVSGLLLHQNGRDMRAARIGDVPAMDRKRASVDPATFDGYVGWYEPPPPRNIVTVTRDGDHLFVQETGQARSEIIARSAAGYVASGGSGPDILFEPAEQSRPSALIMYDEARGAVRAPWVAAARARQIEDVAARQIADAPGRFKNQMPAAGSAAALRHHFDALGRGAPDYDQMNPRLAEQVRQQLPSFLYMFTALGSLESMVFKGVGPGGFDIYDVKFTRGAAQVRLSLTEDGKLQGLNFRPDGDGTPGAVVACSQESTLRPTTGTAPIRMTFVNRSGSDIRLFGVDFAGKRVPYVTILDEGSALIGAAMTQPLVVTDPSERCLEIVLPGSATQNIAITAAVPDGSPGQATAPRNTPLPGSEAALRQLIDGIRRGEPDYARMSTPAADGTRQQLRLVQEIMNRMGPVQAISFVGVAPTGADIYQVKCENGSTEVRLDLLKDGRIGGLTLGPE